jgi:hypothetical protein
VLTGAGASEVCGCELEGTVAGGVVFSGGSDTRMAEDANDQRFLRCERGDGVGERWREWMKQWKWCRWRDHSKGEG